MAVEIKVGPPVLTINQGNTFMITTEDGEIDREEPLGIFAQDTRFISYYHFFIDMQQWKLLTSSQIQYFAARLHLTNPRIETESGVLPADTIGLRIDRCVGGGIHEDFYITNYDSKRVSFFFEMVLRCDFADIFEVKVRQFVERGHLFSEWHQNENGCYESVTTYQNKGFRRQTIYRFVAPSSPPSYANGRIIFEISLDPGQTWHTCGYIILVYDGRMHEPTDVCHASLDRSTPMERHQIEWRRECAQLFSSNDQVVGAFQEAVDDMGSLRFHLRYGSEEVWVPAAGVPWFVTLFGRDSLIVSFQNMMVYPSFALGSLRALAELQAMAMDDWRDAEPGKIPHEIRFGELAYLNRIPHTPYYGTHDATPLYLIVLSEAYRWFGDAEGLRAFRATAERCLAWIDRYGDRDGDGFQEYKTRSPVGYHNQGWKDAWDAVVYPDGSQVPAPIALCELQGYVYDAKLRMAELFRAWGEATRAAELEKEAAMLRQRFNEAFWVDSEKFYAFGLDPKKARIETAASNPGHCLWSGIVPSEKAGRVVHRLLEGDLFSGWGIRTLSSRNPAYNPFSYQLGSVWPHDNGIIAAGFKRYGFDAEANLVAGAIFETAGFFDQYRFPELFSGLQRVNGDFPVQYRGASIPQAWAAGSIFHLLRTILGLEADAPHRRLYLRPTLPEWLPDITLTNLRVGKVKINIHFYRKEGRSFWKVLNQQGEIDVIEKEIASGV